MCAILSLDTRVRINYSEQAKGYVGSWPSKPPYIALCGKRGGVYEKITSALCKGRGGGETRLHNPHSRCIYNTFLQKGEH
jgi:hypothetical protein